MQTYDLDCSRDHAFAVYTARIGEWWHPDYTAAADRFQGVTIEPRIGGRVFASYDDTEDEWGRVTAWAPGESVAHTFNLAQDPAHPSQLSVTFSDRGAGCSMRFEHGGWDDANAEARDKFTEWRVILDRFARLAEERRPAGRDLT